MWAKDEHRCGRLLADQRSLGKETGREGKGRMKKKMNQLFGSLGSERARVADSLMPKRLPFTIREPRGFLQELVLLCKALLSPG